MGYSDGEALILTRVQACSNFDSTNTDRTDWKKLNTGNSDHYAILRPGEFRINWMALSSYHAVWTTVIELWMKYTDDGTTQASLYGYLNDLFAILAYPHMGDSSTVLDANITGGPEPQEMWPRSGGPVWLRWNINIEWTEETNVTFSE